MRVLRLVCSTVSHLTHQRAFMSHKPRSTSAAAKVLSIALMQATFERRFLTGAWFRVHRAPNTSNTQCSPYTEVWRYSRACTSEAWRQDQRSYRCEVCSYKSVGCSLKAMHAILALIQVSTVSVCPFKSVLRPKYVVLLWVFQNVDDEIVSFLLLLPSTNSGTGTAGWAGQH